MNTDKKNENGIFDWVGFGTESGFYGAGDCGAEGVPGGLGRGDVWI
jgi:hypothetical protein